MKLRRKLLSAGFALGATALTLTTSTFAWYTANSEVTANQISATSGANGDSLLMISTTSNPSDFSNSVSWGAFATNLQPVAYHVGTGAAAATFKPTFKSFASGSESGDVTVTTGTDSTVYQVDLYFKSSTNSHVYLKTLNVVNETDVDGTAAGQQLPTKDVLTTAGTDYSAAYLTNTAPTYTVDLLRALKIAYCTETVSTAAATTYSTGAAYTFGSGATADFGCTYLSDTTIASPGVNNAHQYYEGVTGNEIDASSTGVTGTEITSTSDSTISTSISAGVDFGITPATLAKGNYLLVHFYFFIDGWDKDCFDAVQGQTFSVNFTFSSKDPNEV